MHAFRTEALVVQGPLLDLWRDTGVDVFLRQPACRVFRQYQLVYAAPRVGERRRHRVPAVQDDGTVRVCLAPVPGRPAAGFASLFRRLATAAPEVLLSLAIAHGPACVM